MASTYQFRPMSAHDLSMVHQWLKSPHLRQWWGEPETQFALVSEDLDQPAMKQFIVVADNQPFAYLQCYDPKSRLVNTPDGRSLLMVRDL